MGTYQGKRPLAKQGQETRQSLKDQKYRRFCAGAALYNHFATPP